MPPVLVVHEGQSALGALDVVPSLALGHSGYKVEVMTPQFLAQGLLRLRRLCRWFPPHGALGTQPDHGQLEPWQRRLGNHLINGLVDGQSIVLAGGPVVHYESPGSLSVIPGGRGGIEHLRVGAVVNHGGRPGWVEPPLAVVVPDPARNEDGRVRDVFRTTRRAIYGRRRTPCVGLVDMANAPGGRVPDPESLDVCDVGCDVLEWARGNEQHALAPRPEPVRNPVSAFTHVAGQLGHESTAALPGLGGRVQADFKPQLFAPLLRPTPARAKTSDSGGRHSKWPPMRCIEYPDSRNND